MRLYLSQPAGHGSEYYLFSILADEAPAKRWTRTAQNDFVVMLAEDTLFLLFSLLQ